jgi:excisionase family DNA binding protein
MAVTETAELPRLMTAQQLAAYLGVPGSTVYLWRSRAIGPPGFRVGKQVRYREADVLEWLNERRQGRR